MTTRLLDPSLFVPVYFFFFFNDTATTEIYTLSLHDALPIFFLLNLLDFHSRRGRAPAHFARAQANAVAHRRAQRSRHSAGHEAHHAPGPHAQTGHPPAGVA